MITTIYPTGTCFDDISAFIFPQYIFPLVRKGVDVHGLIRIGHGICSRTEKGAEILYSHAWIQHDRPVIQGGPIIIETGLLDGHMILVEIERGLFFRDRKITDFTYYSMQEFGLMQLLYGHPGPFEERYHVLCNDGHSPFVPPKPEVAAFVEEMRMAMGNREKIQYLIDRDRKERITGLDWDKKGQQKMR